MPVIYKDWIVRTDLKKNPEMIFLFGDNAIRRGLGGQAKQMRGEPNAVGIRTKWLPSMAPVAFWTDEQYDECTVLLDEDFEKPLEHVKSGGIVVIPQSGLGTGLSDLPNKAPLIHEYLQGWVNRLETAAVEQKNRGIDFDF